jgi:hypothetical protein
MKHTVTSQTYAKQATVAARDAILLELLQQHRQDLDTKGPKDRGACHSKGLSMLKRLLPFTEVAYVLY